MKITFAVILLTTAAITSARAQGSASLAGYTYRVSYNSGVATMGEEGKIESIDLLSDGTFVTRFVIDTESVAYYTGSYSTPVSGTYSYAAISQSQATLSLQYDGGGSTTFTLLFSDGMQGTTNFGGINSPFSINATGGIISSRALINMSTLIPAQAGSPVSFGFVVGGIQAREILIRAVGPSLAQFGINGFAANPVYTLSGGPTMPGEASTTSPGQGWSATAAAAATIMTEDSRAGAFRFLEGSTDKADIFLLAPGAYTITVNPTDPSEVGTELIEVYEVE